MTTQLTRKALLDAQHVADRRVAELLETPFLLDADDLVFVERCHASRHIHWLTEDIEKIGYIYERVYQ